MKQDNWTDFLKAMRKESINHDEHSHLDVVTCLDIPLILSQSLDIILFMTGSKCMPLHHKIDVIPFQNIFNPFRAE